MVTNKIFRTVFASCLFLWFQGADSSRMRTDTENIRISGNLMADALASIARQYKVVIGFETASPDMNLVSIRIDQASLKDALNSVVGGTSRHSWAQTSNGTIRVFERNKALDLPNISVSSVNGKNLHRYEVATALEGSAEVRGWIGQHGCTLALHVIATAGQPPDEPQTVTITETSSLRDALDVRPHTRRCGSCTQTLRRSRCASFH
jgi:hypothetical protein